MLLFLWQQQLVLRICREALVAAFIAPSGKST
jgi:hypothetical protein